MGLISIRSNRLSFEAARRLDDARIFTFVRDGISHDSIAKIFEF